MRGGTSGSGCSIEVGRGEFRPIHSKEIRFGAGWSVPVWRRDCGIEVALEAGNSPAMIFQHYRELVTPTDAKKWFSVSPHRKGKLIDLQPAQAAAA